MYFDVSSPLGLNREHTTKSTIAGAGGGPPAAGGVPGAGRLGARGGAVRRPGRPPDAPGGRQGPAAGAAHAAGARGGRAGADAGPDPQVRPPKPALRKCSDINLEVPRPTSSEGITCIQADLAERAYIDRDQFAYVNTHRRRVAVPTSTSACSVRKPSCSGLDLL